MSHSVLFLILLFIPFKLNEGAWSPISGAKSKPNDGWVLKKIKNINVKEKKKFFHII